MSRTTVVCFTLAALCVPAAGRAESLALRPPVSDAESALAVAAITRELPAIGAENRLPGGQRVALEGLLSTATISSHLALVNLAPATSICSLALTGADGERIGPVLRLMLRPLETRSIPHLFAPLTAAGSVTAGRALASCTQDFYAYAVVGDLAGDRLSVVTPFAVETDALSVTAALEACPPHALCYDAEGIVHIPTPELPTGRVAFPVAIGTTRRLRMSIDVTVGPWYPANPSLKHLIYWFVVSKNLHMPGMLYFRGPSKNEAFARHGMALPHERKIKIIKKFAAEVDTTYHIVNDYDMGKGKYTITISDAATGAIKAVLKGKPNKPSFLLKPGDHFLVDMGFMPPGENPTEVPSFDWEYANVHIESYQ